jgi:DNA-binding winged helix-turn-helix (wHTH) protein
MRVVFGDCVLDTGTRQVLRAGRSVRVSPKAYELLRILAEARPRALSKDELYAQLWPDTFVVEANLANLVAELRAALADSAHEPRIIRTVHGFGYAFCADARVSVETAPRIPSTCGLIWSGRKFDLTAGENIVGREPDVHVRFDLPSVSRRHAKLMVSDQTATIEDLGSKNGTSVGGRAIAEATALQDGDEIAFGSVVVTFRVWSPSGSTETLAGR